MTLEVNHLSVEFSRYHGLFGRVRVPALCDISLSVRPGEMLAVVGASGAGKSLLAHAILGLLPPNARCRGEMALEGVPLCAARQQRLRGRTMALVPQSITHLDPLATVGRQIVWAGRRAGMGPIDPAAVLARFGLGPETARLYPHTLSGGMARRVLLAIATIGDPRLIVADEPTAGLDGDMAQKGLALLRARAERGAAVIVISHDLPAVAPYADAVCLIDQGRSVESAPARAFTGAGTDLPPLMRALWRALPENGFGSVHEEAPRARSA